MSGAGHLILVIEDEPQIRHFLRTTLTAEGYRVIESETGERGALEAATHKPDLVMVDLGLPDLDGVEVVKRIRTWSALPILILSARSAEADKVAALDAGADDYVTKPFGVGELTARIRVALRHAAHGATQETAGTLRFVDIEVDLERRLVHADGRNVHLTPIEFRLLGCLARHAGMVLTHRHLLREVWGPSHVEQSHYLRIYMKQLRHKLEPDPARPRFLLTETGVGYRLAGETEPAAK
ncbi:MAG: response regulator [Burkholderiales bacterium]|jgi:two-component system KDP operon response regulator KdpE